MSTCDLLQILFALCPSGSNSEFCFHVCPGDTPFGPLPRGVASWPLSVPSRAWAPASAQSFTLEPFRSATRRFSMSLIHQSNMYFWSQFHLSWIQWALLSTSLYLSIFLYNLCSCGKLELTLVYLKAINCLLIIVCKHRKAWWPSRATTAWMGTGPGLRWLK